MSDTGKRPIGIGLAAVGYAREDYILAREDIVERFTFRDLTPSTTPDRRTPEVSVVGAPELVMNGRDVAAMLKSAPRL